MTMTCLRRSTRLLRPLGTFPFRSLSSKAINELEWRIEHPHHDTKHFATIHAKDIAKKFDALCLEAAELEGGGGAGGVGLDGLVRQARAVALDLVTLGGTLVGTTKITEVVILPKGGGGMEVEEERQKDPLGPMSSITGGDAKAFWRWVHKGGSKVAELRGKQTRMNFTPQLSTENFPLTDSEMEILGEVMGLDWRSPQGQAVIHTHSNWLVWAGACEIQREVVAKDRSKKSGFRRGGGPQHHSALRLDGAQLPGDHPGGRGG